MSILIKGIEIPKVCGQCQIKLGIDCELWRHVRSVSLDRHKDCPLVPVPPHGRLIDADAIRAGIDEKRPGRSYEDAWALTVIDAAPTIIPAEEGEA